MSDHSVVRTKNGPDTSRYGDTSGRVADYYPGIVGPVTSVHTRNSLPTMIITTLFVYRNLRVNRTT